MHPMQRSRARDNKALGAQGAQCSPQIWIHVRDPLMGDIGVIQG